MKVQFWLAAIVAAFFFVGCSGGSGAEKEAEVDTKETAVEADETEETMDEKPAASGKAALADCGGGAVPADATSCRLDLGLGTDSYWDDTDGVDPGTAGCHYEYTDDTCGTFKSGRTFGELCLDSDRLVESNPGADECHTHKGDLGGPDVVSCSAWCAEQGKSSGSCVDGIAATGKNGDCQSARCECG